MSRFAGCRLYIALALVAIVGGRQSARADLITNVGVSTAPVSGGLTQYDYTVSDESSSTITASFFFVAVDTTANLSAMTAPAVGTSLTRRVTRSSSSRRRIPRSISSRARSAFFPSRAR